ncbi:hypothetical protein CYMTET_15699 [Cymbomonas tetramitiformis]|uniref:Uncharacterized protein n=1 Tax=Cymbomonas tetramitiformis TaxID=36881 RepID=A0AAE0L8W6_9CHLO|nr:hypothetical protein CYMTET_15699 [Cymbomonas tetramitiformis]
MGRAEPERSSAEAPHSAELGRIAQDVTNTIEEVFDMAENDPFSGNGGGLLWETMAFIDPDEARIAFEKLILKRIAGEVPPSKLRRGRSELSDEDVIFRKNYRNHDMIPIVLNVQRKGEYRISSEGRDMLDHLSNYTAKSEEIMRGVGTSEGKNQTNDFDSFARNTYDSSTDCKYLYIYVYSSY